MATAKQCKAARDKLIEVVPKSDGRFKVRGIGGWVAKTEWCKAFLEIYWPNLDCAVRLEPHEITSIKEVE